MLFTGARTLYIDTGMTPLAHVSEHASARLANINLIPLYVYIKNSTSPWCEIIHAYNVYNLF